MSNKLIATIQEITVMQNENDIISLSWVNSKHDLSCQISDDKNISNITPSTQCGCSRHSRANTTVPCCHYSDTRRQLLALKRAACDEPLMWT
jgi:hypothetical protein